METLGSLQKDISFPNGSGVYFLNDFHAKDYLVKDEDMTFFNILSPIEFYLRTNIKSESKNDFITEKEVVLIKEYVQKEVMNWTRPEKKKIIPAILEVFDKCNKISTEFFPKSLYFIKCKGQSEGIALYTRGSAIIIPKYQIELFLRAEEDVDFQELIIHEIFHIYSRFHPEMRERLYQAIGFRSLIHPISFGSHLNRIKITNPDCTLINHYIELSLDDQEEKQKMVMVDYANSEIWAKEKDITSYLTSKLFYIELLRKIEDDSEYWQIIGGNDRMPEGIDPLSRKEPKLNKSKKIDPRDDIDFLHQTGYNTFYISHPEEIIADNIAILGMFLSGYDAGEIDTNGIKILSSLSQIFGEKTYTLFQEQQKFQASKKLLPEISQRQKKRLMERSINEGKRSRKKID
jgi:hypothetical protein